MGSTESRDMEQRDSTSKLRASLVPRVRTLGLVLLMALSFVPTASAHASESSPISTIPQWYGLVVLIIGLVVLGGSVLLKRTQRIRPTTALYGVFVGLVVTTVGAIGFTELAPEASYTASSMPFPRVWYQPITLLVGFTIMILSVIFGRFRWPTRPRYTVLGLELGLWVAYPVLITGGGEYTHPLGYVLVGSVPLTVGYILWKDCLDAIRIILRDTTARRFGAGIALVIALFLCSQPDFCRFSLRKELAYRRRGLS